MWFCLLKVSCGTKVFISWYNIETEEGLTLSGSKGWLYKLCYYVNLYSMGHIWIVIRKSLRLNPDPTTATKRKLLMHLKFKRFEFGTPWPSQLHEVFNQARIQEFSSGGGGSYIPENVWPAKQKLNKKRQKGGGGGRGASVFFLHCYGRNRNSHWNSFHDNSFHKYDLPQFFIHAKTHLT